MWTVLSGKTNSKTSIVMNNNLNSLKLSALRYILKGLIKKYKERVPDVSKILTAMINEGIIESEDEIENDHIAFRTIGVPNLGVASLEKIFLHYGYKKMDYYFFPEKKLNAWWYTPPVENLPRIFISELRVEDLSLYAERTIKAYTDTVKKDPVDLLDLDDPESVDLFLHSSLWRLPTLVDYKLLSKESEYAAWVIYNRYYLNHFTIAIHDLKEGYNTIEQFNEFLERNGITLNDAGGKIKRSPDGRLLQSSTVAEMVEASFAYGHKKTIPGSYVEFAERKVLEYYKDLPANMIRQHHRREGFEASNADKIFESTYLEQTEKR
jgi:hypothetical protein